LNYFNYFSEIEETFIRRRGKSLLLSPLDWTLIESWQKRGIPQHIVIRSVEKIFDDIAKDPKRNPSVKSIAYCADEVERQYRNWLSSQAGSEKGREEDDGASADNSEIISHLTNLIEGVRGALENADKNLQTVLSEVLKDLTGLKERFDSSSPPDAETVENELTRLETLVDKALLESAGEKSLNDAQKAVEEHLGQYAGKMQQDVYEKTFELMVIKKLREKAGVPAFSLFYL
jgi:hypothetical protein